MRLLRQARRDAGLNQREVAERMGESTLFISRCERGERRMDAVELLAFCQAIGQAPADFVRQLQDTLKSGN